MTLFLVPKILKNSGFERVSHSLQRPSSIYVVINPPLITGPLSIYLVINPPLTQAFVNTIGNQSSAYAGLSSNEPLDVALNACTGVIFLVFIQLPTPLKKLIFKSTQFMFLGSWAFWASLRHFQPFSGHTKLFMLGFS